MAVAISQFGMVDESRRNVHPFFAPRDCPNPTAREDSVTRKKRRRTSLSVQEETITLKKPKDLVSNDSSQEWESQLRAAAYGEHPLTRTTLEPIPSVEVESGRHTTMNRRVIKSNPLSKAGGTSSVLHVEITKPPLSGLGTMPTAPPKEQAIRTSTKKMIAICSGGKLVSPQPASLAPNSNAKRKGRDTKSAEDTKKKIVKLKYGSTDVSRKFLGRRIQEICSGPTAKPIDEITILEASISPVDLKPKDEKMISEASISTAAVKPTHPFFLGAMNRTKDSTAVHESAVERCSVSGDIEEKHHTNGDPDELNTLKETRRNSNGADFLPKIKETLHKLRESGLVRNPGALEPIWPPKEMVHVRPTIYRRDVSSHPNKWFPDTCGRRKLKYAKVYIAEEEEILHSYSVLARAQAMNKDKDKSKTDKVNLNQPRRKVMAGSELQKVAGSLLAHEVPSLLPVDSQKNTPRGLHTIAGTLHAASLRLLKDMASSRTAFDRFECEAQDWIHKYSPQCANEVLQSGREALVLRDWLKSLTVTSVGNASSEFPKGQDKVVSSKGLAAISKKKKRKRAEGLDDFVISSDEETVEMKELANPEIHESDARHTSSGKRSIICAASVSSNPAERQRIANAVVISGPHGCGKTAAVYAVARELGFEVFEINSGSRRSGKDILEKVGDMAKNHLVNQACEAKGHEISKGTANVAGLFIPEVNSSYQSSLKLPKVEIKKKPRGRPKIHPKPLETSENPKKKPSQKQSLILLEEVDVLFEEDRQFWVTTLDLILHSKRPIIMTCTDESLLPLDEMALFAVLRFTPPPEQLAIDYLTLIASSEGHLLSRSTLSRLLRSKQFDLRASITELNFYCQMAIGDTKGGLEWMLIQPSRTENQMKNGDDNLRVVSVGTYGEDLDHVECMQQIPDATSYDRQTTSLLSGNWERRNFDEYCGEPRLNSSSDIQGRQNSDNTLQNLVVFGQAIDAISAADTYMFSGSRQNDVIPLDTSLPDLSEKFKTNFVEGSTVLQSEPVIDQSGVSTMLNLTVESYALQMQQKNVGWPFTPVDREKSLQLMPEITPKLPLEKKLTRADVTTAFDPIAGPSRLPLAVQRGSHISTFDGPISLVLEDVAPYVRSIVFYDLKLEEHRLRLNSILAQDGRNGKKMRTTRASHAALEGGSKANTRREKWFPVESNFSLILQTGGDGWQEIAWQKALDRANVDPGQVTVASSVHSTTGSDH